MPNLHIDPRLTRVLFEAVWEWELESNTLTWISELDMFGYAANEIGGELAWWRERVHPDDLSKMDARLARAIESRADRWTNEYRFRRRDGTWATVATHGLLDLDANGKPLHATGAMMDISRLRDTEHTLRDTRRLLELVLETLPVGVAVLDAKANTIMFNAASQRIWGGVIPSVADERYTRSVGRWHDTGKRIETADWASQHALKEGATTLNELVDIDRYDGGETRTIRNSSAPLRDDGDGIIGAVVVNEDVTERVRAEETLQRRERQQAALARLGLSALRASELGALWNEACATLAATLGVEYAMIFEWMPGEHAMKFRAGAGPLIEEIFERVPVPTTPRHLAWFYMHADEPVVFADHARDTRFTPCEVLAAHGVKSGIAVPIAGKERRFGVVEANTKAERHFSDDEVELVWGVANVLATAIERARATAELRTLSRKLIEAQEAERRAIARELHDDFGQVLTALKLNLLSRSPNDKDNLTLVDGALARMRDLAQDLRPPQLDELGLESSLRWYVEREAARAGLDVALAFEPLPVTPPAVVATTCFRVVQEALTNIVRHASAHHVWIELREVGSELEVVVRDDGVGFDVTDARMRAVRGESQGLLGMEERVQLVSGKLVIESSRGRATTIRARLPIAGGGQP